MCLSQLRYSEFIFGLKEQNINLNRKMLSEVARFEPLSFGVRRPCGRLEVPLSA